VLTKEAEQYLDRWSQAGLLDPQTTTKIRDFESRQSPPAKTRWAAAIAWSLGALLIGAGIISFVAANWQEIPQSLRIALIVLLTLSFHVAAAFSTSSPALRLALHGVGTACLGAGIALAGQIFNLSSGWNGWMLLWAIGSLAGYLLIRDWLQLILAALLVPAWITSEWERRGPTGDDDLPILLLWFGLILLYFLSRYKPLVWLGGISLVALNVTVLLVNAFDKRSERDAPISAYWACAIVLLALALLGYKVFGGFNLRGFAAIAAAALASYVAYHHSGWPIYPILGLCFVALCAWGVSEQRVELVNVGIACFAITVFGFYLSHALSLLGSSVGLIATGLVLVAGGFALEKTRRKLLEQMA